MELNKIYNQDCMAGMLEIPDKSIDMILCDLPYGITACEWDKKLPVNELWTIYNRIIKDNGAVVLTAAMKFAAELINANIKNFRYDLIWQKSLNTGFANANKMPMRKHELILVFYKRLPVYHPQGLVKLEKPLHVEKPSKTGGVYRADSLQKPYTQKYTNYPNSILTFSNSNNKNSHPTQKPLELFKYLILTYTNEGDTVLDNCMGSGTTAAACIKTGRNFIGFETDEKYYNIANERINSAKMNLSAV